MRKILLLIITALFFGASSVYALNYTFTGNGDGSSAQDPLNWDIGFEEGEPFSNYDSGAIYITIPEGFTVINNGTINWGAASIIYGPGTFINYGTFNVTSVSNNSLGDGLLFINHGTMLLDSEETDGTIHSFGVGQDVVINNESDGTITLVDIKFIGGGYYSNFGAFNNNGGTLIKAGDTEITQTVMTKNFGGTFNINEGTFNISATGAENNSYQGGTYNVMPETTFAIFGNYSDFSGDLQGNIEGEFIIQNYVNIIGNSSFNFTNNGPKIYFSVIAGGGTLTNNSPITFINSGTGTSKTLTDSTTIINHSTLNYVLEGSSTPTHFHLGIGSKIQNESDGTINFDYMAVEGGVTTELINNEGTINVTYEDGSVSIACPFTNNNGTINVSGEELITHTASRNTFISGVINVADSSQFIFADSTFFEGTITGINEGTLYLGGEIMVEDEVNFDVGGNGFQSNFTQFGGDGVFKSHTKSYFFGAIWKNFNDSFQFQNFDEMTVETTSQFFRLDDTSSLINQESGTIILRDAGNIRGDGEVPFLTNYGTIIKEGTGTATMNITSNHNGTIEVFEGELLFHTPYHNNFNTSIINIADNATMTLFDSTFFEGTITGINEGTLSFGGEIMVDDEVNFDVGGNGFQSNFTQFVGDGVFKSHTKSYFFGAVWKNFNDSFQFQNFDEMTVETTSQNFRLDDTSSLINQESGTIILRNTGNIRGDGEIPFLTNFGTIIKEGTGTATMNITSNHNGTIEVTEGELLFHTPYHNNFNTSIINIADNATMTLFDSTFFEGTITGINEGTLSFGGEIMVEDEVNFDVGGNGFQSHGTQFGGDGLFKSHTKSYFFGAIWKNFNDSFQFQNFDEMTVETTSQYFRLDDTSSLINQESGTIILNDSGNIRGSGEVPFLTNYGTIIKEGDGSAQIKITTDNYGTIDVAEGQIIKGGQTAFHNHQEGVVTGYGIFTADNWLDVTNDGVFAPGSPVGKLRVQNQYIQSELGVLEIDINGSTPEIDYDVLEVSSNANVSGTIEVHLGYEPAINDEFVVLTAYANGYGVTCDLPSTISTIYNNFNYTFDVICNDQDITLKLTGIQDVTSVDEWNNPAHLSIFPNPMTDQATIDFSWNENPTAKELILVNSLGQEVKQFPVNNNQKTYRFNRDGLPSGIYFVQLISKNEVLQTQKLVVN